LICLAGEGVTLGRLFTINPIKARKKTAPIPVITPTMTAKMDNLASPIRGGNSFILPIPRRDRLIGALKCDFIPRDVWANA
jgi:hypothetical protein